MRGFLTELGFISPVKQQDQPVVRDKKHDSYAEQALAAAAANVAYQQHHGKQRRKSDRPEKKLYASTPSVSPQIVEDTTVSDMVTGALIGAAVAELFSTPSSGSCTPSDESFSGGGGETSGAGAGGSWDGDSNV